MEVQFCEIDGPVRGGMQFRVLVEVPLCEIGACSLECWWRSCFGKIDGRVLGGMQFRVLVEVPLCETDGRVLGGMQFAVLITVLVPVLFKALMDSGGALSLGCCLRCW